MWFQTISPVYFAVCKSQLMKHSYSFWVSSMFSELSIFSVLDWWIFGTLLFSGGACSCHPAGTQHRIQKDTKPSGGEFSFSLRLSYFFPYTCSSLSILFSTFGHPFPLFSVLLFPSFHLFLFPHLCSQTPSPILSISSLHWFTAHLC